MTVSAVTDLALERVVRVLRQTSVPFWIAGGWAIDLFVGGATRSHTDIDIQIVRGDDSALAAHLVGWDLHIAHEGTLAPWTPEHRRNAIWCRESADAPWAFELVLADVVDDRWVYRRDPRITRPVAEIELRTETGLAFVCPEIQLLFKSKGLRPKDEADFQAALPRMDPAAREWLRGALHQVDEHHVWLAQL